MAPVLWGYSEPPSIEKASSGGIANWKNRNASLSYPESPWHVKEMCGQGSPEEQN